MFVCNFKLNSNKIIKYVSVFLCICILILCGIAIYKIFGNIISNNRTTDTLKKGSVCEIDANNYTNILDEVHNNLDMYVGQKIKFSGFVYKIYDFFINKIFGTNLSFIYIIQNRPHIIIL